METRRIFQTILLVATLTASLLSSGSAAALSACGTSYVVQRGDTLSSIARTCGTTVAALKLANPNLGYWIYAGQTIWLPGAVLDGGNGATIYLVARGDTLKSLAARFGTTMSLLASWNNISNYNLIYEGQRLTILSETTPTTPPPPAPPSAGTYVVQWGDTMRKIAARLNVSLSDLLAVNPQIGNPNLIFFGQVVNVPASASVYTVQRGDTLRLVAARFGTTVDMLLHLNPQIWNANWIYAGEVVRIR